MRPRPRFVLRPSSTCIPDAAVCADVVDPAAVATAGAAVRASDESRSCTGLSFRILAPSPFRERCKGSRDANRHRMCHRLAEGVFIAADADMQGAVEGRFR